MVRFGLIACSSIARRRFLPALRGAAGARLARVGSRDPARAAALAREFGCARSGDSEAVLADAEVDAVYVSLPIALQAAAARRALEAGRHVLVEKPAVTDAGVARELAALAAQQGRRLMEGFAFRWHPQHALARRLIAEGRIGTPRVFLAEFTYPRPPAGDWRLDPGLGGGVFRDAGGYPVAAARLVLGAEPEAVSCRLHFESGGGVDDTMAATLHFADGAVAQCVAGFGLLYRSRYAITGSAGRIEVERAYSVAPEAATTVTVETNAGLERLSVPPADQFRLMVEAFAAEVSAGARAQDFEGELLRQITVMDAAWRSHQEGRLATVEDLNT